MSPSDRLRVALFVRMMDRWGGRITRALQRRHEGDDEALVRAFQAALGIAVEQDIRAHKARDTLTVLQCAYGCRATKKIIALHPEGVLDYAAGLWFATTEIEVAGFGELAAALETLQLDPRVFVIRGKLKADRAPGRVRRLLYPDAKTGDPAFFGPKARRWLALDFDSFALPVGVDPVDVAAVAALARVLLPAEFRSVACWAQLTSGAGIKGGGRCRLWYWLDSAVTDTEAKIWLRDAPVDHALFVGNTPHYVAKPVLGPGIADPAPTRSLVLPGEADAVAVPLIVSEPEPKASPDRQRPAFVSFVSEGVRNTPRFSRGSSRYLALVVDGVRQAPAGQGRQALTSAALRLYAKADRIDPVRATALLKQVMIDRGWGTDETTRGMTMTDIGRQLDWCWQIAGPK